MRRQWQETHQLYTRHLLHVLGPLICHASDGDSRRRKLHIENSTSNVVEHYDINHSNFTMSRKIMNTHGKTDVTDLSDQDSIHNNTILSITLPSLKTTASNVCLL